MAKGFIPSCRIRQTVNGDWIITPPPGARLYIDADTRIHDHLSYHRRPDLQARRNLESTWISRTSPADNSWRSVCWSPELGLFCAVADTGAGNRVMTSPDGVTWTIRVSAADNSWRSVCWSPELGLFCAVARSGTDDRVMTSPDGITWTIRVSAADNDWRSVCWSPELGLFCAVSASGVGNRVMTSPDGITWTIRVSAADNSWQSICWSPELSLFCAVSITGTGDRVMTSPDGITWTIRVSAADNDWCSVCWSPELGLFCAVSNTGTDDRVMTSPDGITWTLRVSAVDNNWRSVCWSPELGLFCAVSNTGTDDRVMTSACSRCRIQTNDDGDWRIMPPAGQITQIGEGVCGLIPPVTNDDMVVSGKLVTCDDMASAHSVHSEFLSEVVGDGGFALIGREYGESAAIRMRTEEITIPIGSGIAGVASALNMFQTQSVILMVYCRVVQAPGGGATWLSIYKTGTPADELIFQKATALDATYESSNDSDGTHDGPWYSDSNATLTVITDANVTVADMIVRVGVLYLTMWNFDS